MYTVWKKALELTEEQYVYVPGDAEILTAREQAGELCIWFKCNPDNPPRERKIYVVGTGHPAPEGARYVGTGFLYNGALVLHVFQ